MGALQPWHLILILAIVVLLFGGAKIPELMRGVGKGMGEFKKGMEDGKKPPEDETPAKKDETPVAKT
jgi:sec-independent protein translocase protein TatA